MQFNITSFHTPPEKVCQQQNSKNVKKKSEGGISRDWGVLIAGSFNCLTKKWYWCNMPTKPNLLRRRLP
jgi:hypothetical protein